MRILIDIADLTRSVKNFIEEISPAILISTTPQEIVRHEFDCVFFGDTYREFSISPLVDAYNVARCPTDIRTHIDRSIKLELEKLVNSKVSHTTAMYDYNLLWISPFQVYVEAL